MGLRITSLKARLGPGEGWGSCLSASLWVDIEGCGLSGLPGWLVRLPVQPTSEFQGGFSI